MKNSVLRSNLLYLRSFWYVIPGTYFHWMKFSLFPSHSSSPITFHFISSTTRLNAKLSYCLFECNSYTNQLKCRFWEFIMWNDEVFCQDFNKMAIKYKIQKYLNLSFNRTGLARENLSCVIAWRNIAKTLR